MKDPTKDRSTHRLAACCIVAVALLTSLPVVRGADSVQWDVFETSYEPAKGYLGSVLVDSQAASLSDFN